ncbi:peptidoglycan synthase FtsI precursor [bacterium BMS3Bbin11]|nr:peptidoglycan synthase FtsI precursor [bacterium BMS3Abin11]GBE45013.1 peptidoglycan synthase FtsI precursor [bacterium BMS3Bbin11]GMT39999.1 MAG: penicillin-binding protein 3 [bacterium]HDH07877.1 penicillin-binding protein 2 [Gammaproteobacteria bacterium]HDH15641.1 penicillin-binding protein 2 [Gammaproteobacteria bacterium]
MRRAVSKKRKQPLTSSVRHWLVLAVIGSLFAVMAGRALFLQFFNADFLKQRGNAQALKVIDVSAVRGMILDRNGQPLAVSTPVDAVSADPSKLYANPKSWKPLAKILGISYSELKAKIKRNRKRRFIYLNRQVLPDTAERAMALDIEGVFLRREYKRYYPLGAVTGHLVGFTNVDGRGLEGIELAYNESLRGHQGKDQVIRDASGHIIEHVSNIERAADGEDLVLSIDSRIQYLAYRALKKAVVENKATSASAVVVDVRSGEILAMVNEPGYNPNNRRQLRSSRFRNRAVTDSFEPGSTVKPLTVVAALENHYVTPQTIIETDGGTMKLARFTIRDTHDYGNLSVSDAIMKSSNVAAAKMALKLKNRELWSVLNRVGFGQQPGSGLPGEAKGAFQNYSDWRDIRRATIGYGYGLSVTPLQLTQAYATLANDGRRVPLSILRRSDAPAGKQVISTTVAKQVRSMLELAVSDEGTGKNARIPMYHVAGKTGTSRKAEGKGYSKRYNAIFAGMAPATRPRLAMVVVVNEPSSGKYYGGTVAAPVFASVMTGALRLLDVAPDDVSEDRLLIATGRNETGQERDR